MSGSSIQIRPARAGDMAAVGEIVVRSWRHTFEGLLPQDFLSSLTQAAQQRRHERSFARGGVRYRVAVDGNDVIGFASGGPGRDPGFSGRSELYAFYLMPGFERRGIGRRLFDGVIAELAASGRQGLYLTALAVNPNRAFYVSLRGVELDGPGIRMGGDSYPQVAFLWERLPIAASSGYP